MSYIPTHAKFLPDLDLPEFLRGKQVLSSDELYSLTVSGCDLVWNIDLHSAVLHVFEYQHKGVALWFGIVSFRFGYEQLDGIRESEIVYVENLGFTNNERTGNITRLEMTADTISRRIDHCLRRRHSEVRLEGAIHE